MSLDLALRGVGLRYDDGTEALQAVDLAVPAGTILGLLGRNGAGKSSLMSLVASLHRPTDGRVLVGGRDPWEDAELTAQVSLIGEAAEGGGWKVSDALTSAGYLRPTWDAAYADRLLDLFEIPNVKIAKLSRGKRAALACLFGLAGRAPITMYDEPYLGMDAPTRYAFYDEVLSDYMVHPRTVIISTHHIDEVASLFGRVAILDDGRLVTDDDTDSLRARGTEVTGPVAAVDEFTTGAGLRVLSTRTLGGTRATVTYGELTDDARRRAAAAGLELGPIPLQDLFVHLSGATQPEEASL
jgi:ABC-2 type transport system ATP-binding protein